MKHSFPTRRCSDLLAAIGNAGQRIVQRLVLQVTMELANIGHVHDLGDEMGWPPPFIPGHGDRQQSPDDAAVLSYIALFQPVVLAPPRDQIVDQLEIGLRLEEHTSELQSLMRTSYAVCCLKKKTIVTNY